MMHFPLSQIPLFPKKFSDSAKNFSDLTFSQEKFRFSAKISDDHFLIIHHKCRISPLFHWFQFISPYFWQFFFPLLLQIPPWFRKIYVFFIYFMCISFPPTFTMMHLCITQCPTMHVLDAPVSKSEYVCLLLLVDNVYPCTWWGK